MLDLFIVFFLLSFVLAGMFSPAVAFCGYLWADLVQPQLITFGFAMSIPFSLIMAAVCILSMIINRRQVSFPTSSLLFFLIILFIVWFNITTTWATNPASAAYKLDWATKSVAFLLIGFLVINTRASLELFLFAFIGCALYFAMQVGIKSLLSGGGYGRSLVTGGVNNILSETSTLAGVSVAIIPLLFVYAKRSTLFVTNRRFKFLLGMLALLFLISCVGTYARTGLLCLAVLSVGAFILVKRRFRLVFAVVTMLLLVYLVGGEQWRERMATINAPAEDTSALGRLVVWQWTLDYVEQKPLGGGFEAYLDNEGQLGRYVGIDNVDASVRQQPLAYHNMFFEVLGEHGYPGFFLFATMVLIGFVKLVKPMRYKPIGPSGAPHEMDWVKPTAIACFLAFCCVLITYMFVSGAYKPIVYVFIISASCLSHIVAQAGKAAQKESVGDFRQWAV